MLLGGGVVRVAGRDHAQPFLRRELVQRVVVGAVERVAVIPQLDDDVVGAEEGDETVEFGTGVALLERLAHGALAASGQDQPVTARLFGELLEVVHGPTLLPTAQLPARDGRRQPVVPLLLAGEHEQVTALGIGHAVLRTGEPQRELGTEDRGRGADRGGSLRHAHDAVQTVVVGEGQCGQPQPRCLLGERLGHARPVEEAETGVGVQLRVRHHSRAGQSEIGGRHVALAFVRPRRAVTTIGAHRGSRARPGQVGEVALELRPGDGWVGPAHLSRTSLRPTSRRSRARAARRTPPSRRPGTARRHGRRWSTSVRRAATVPPSA